MGKFDEQLKDLREQRDWMLNRAQELRSGRQRHDEFRDNRWVDISPELARDLSLRAARLSTLIVAYEKIND